ncbi:unnamed protein product [Phytophthora fragariaefolia]|uniref:Unnamed protein product n=1 Tax=Phytophthora fragariaefolia TaxID=1490495 RepID=A0A9W6X145_9STRA|nr:unnamed protein product [Phytophthora fragariaefolia]
MVSLLGEAAFAGFPNLSAEQQKARVGRFDKYESLLVAHVSAAAQEAARATMRAEAQSAAQASATNTASFAARPTTTKPVKMSVPTFDGKDSDGLVFWVREIEIALSAGQIYDARAQVAFALSNLGERARAWAMAREMATPGYVTSWLFMVQELRSTFLLVNVAYRHRSNFLRCKQGKRSLQDYVMQLHNLEAAMAGAPLSEDVKVTVFMDGVRTGPVRTELFRRQPKTFNEAVHIAMLEDHCVRSAQCLTPHVEASGGPTPMEISLAESARPQRTQRAGGRCFGCNQPGHFRRNFPTNPWETARDKKHSVRSALNSLEATESENGDSHVKRYPEPMPVLIDSGASFIFVTKASVVRNNALYASALEASKSNTNVSVGLATGSIASRRNVTIPLCVKFDDFNSVEPFIVLDMDDQYDLILGVPWLAKHELWIDWHGFVHEHRVSRDERQVAGSSEVLALLTTSPPRVWEPEVGDGEDPQDPNTSSKVRQGSAVCNRVAFVQGTVTTQGADASAARAGKGGSVRAPPTQSVAAGSAHVDECAGVVARANKSGRVGTPTTQGVVAGSARATEGAGAYARANKSGRAGAPTSKAIRGDKVTSTPKAAASSRDADSAAEDGVPQVLDDFTGEPKVGEVLTPLPTVAELLELKELSYVAFWTISRRESWQKWFYFAQKVEADAIWRCHLKDPSDPYHPFLKEFLDVVSDDPPSVLPPNRGVWHEIDLVPGSKYCTTRQWPLPKEQVDVIDAFFVAMHAAGIVRESKSPHSSPAFCVRKSNGKWRMVHAFNKLNAEAIPASTPIPRKDVLQNNMAGCTVFSALDMVDGYYQLLMRESDIPLTAVSCFLGKDGVRVDPEKVRAIAQWLVPISQKDLRKWLGLANYLHKYSANYADMARPLTNLLKKDAEWSWTSEAQQAFEAIKSSLQSAPILALPDEDRPFSVVCDASDFAIGCALLHVDAEGREWVVLFQSRQLKAAVKNYIIHDKNYGDEVRLGQV